MAPAVNTCMGHRRVGQSAPTSDAASLAYRCSMPLSPSLPYASTLKAWQRATAVVRSMLNAQQTYMQMCGRHPTCPPGL